MARSTAERAAAEVRSAGDVGEGHVVGAAAGGNPRKGCGERAIGQIERPPSAIERHLIDRERTEVRPREVGAGGSVSPMVKPRKVCVLPAVASKARQLTLVAVNTGAVPLKMGKRCPPPD